MGMDAATARLVTVGTVFGSMFCLTLMLGLQCALSCSASKPHCSSLFVFSDNSCGTDKVIFTVFFILMLAGVAATIIGLHFGKNIFFLIFAGICLAAVLFLAIGLVMFIVKTNGNAGHWMFWRGLMMHVTTIAFLVFAAIMTYFTHRGLVLVRVQGM
ncbi:hypothetical protein QR680_016878 [Steinernema hermaphroditum]|uniref:Uncharacterized protein n=1 Tax=Steinernema hermaphroditum TaxID=289476 RepID=A0AA39HDJ2_9BILA|nr:hypothetical protein QR680_016878 [Steinernema hermaphroditum]